MADSTMAHLSEYIKKYRKAQGLSLGQLAEQADVSRSMICQIETGKTVPTLSVVGKLAEAMGASMSQLIDPCGEHQNFCLRRAEDRERVLSSKGAIEFQPLSSESENRSVEIMEFKIRKKGEVTLKKYPPGTTEYYVLQSGEVEFRGVQDTVTLKTGDTVECRASVARSLIQNSAKMGEGVLVRYYSCS